MRTHAPGCTELRPRGNDKEHWRQGTTLGNGAHDIERGRIGPVRIFERQHNRLTPRTGHYQAGKRYQLPAPQFL
jgi:hypothetical protein